MCGFTGWFDPQPQTKDILEQMTSALTHRGPDGVGYYCKGPIALGHRRLAIIDLAASTQPMLSEDKRYVLAYNGELYNFHALRSELESLGHVFRTNGDTEVLLHALIEWREAALPRLQGMFAFAFWDAHEESLLVARDHLGVKPLHIVWDGKKLLFASEIKALLKHPAVSRTLDPNALSLYLECQYIPAPMSIYKEIKKLPAAHFLVLKEGVLKETRYWTPSYLPKFNGSEEDAVEQLGKELTRSVSSMMMADVPLGAFVSGGIDSSLVAALMQQVSGRKAKIFHIGVDHLAHSEHEYAERVAHFLGAEHHPLIIGPDQVLNSLQDWVKAFDEPLGDQAALPSLLLSKLASSHVKVVLTGEGADEIFAGYRNYGKRLKEANICAWLGGKYSPLPHVYPLLPVFLRRKRWIKTIAKPISRRYTTIPTVFDREMHSQLLSSKLRKEETAMLEDLAEPHYFACDSDQYLDRMLHIDTNLWLADDLLMKMDRATMVYSLEARVPYLDHKLVEFAASLPAHWKLQGNVHKYLLKRYAEKDLLPKEIVHRDKRGFVLPLREWLAGKLKPLLEGSLASLMQRKLFNPKTIERLRYEEATKKRLHASRLWALLSLELWFQKYAPDYRA